ncbi:hypothetical protein [Xanthomonas phage JGB6]|nr:hypothetical protein [Xanthomonas phage JGB6]
MTINGVEVSYRAVMELTMRKINESYQKEVRKEALALILRKGLDEVQKVQEEYEAKQQEL